MKKSPKVATIIVSWNSKKFIDACIASVKKSDYKSSIIVVDNNSADKTDLYLKKNYSDITIIQTGDNLGFSGGVNIGIKKALKEKTDYIFLLNPDAFIGEQCIGTLVDAMEKNKRLGMASPIIYYANPSNKIWFAGSDIDWNKGLTPHIGDHEIDNGQYNKPVTIDRICGCSVMIKADALKKVGLFDEKYFLYFEEADLSMRFKEKGYTFKLFPVAKCWHNASTSTGGFFSPLYHYYMTRNNLLFMRSYGEAYFKQFLLHFGIRSAISIARNLKRNPATGIKVARSILKGIKDYSNNSLGLQNYI